MVDPSFLNRTKTQGNAKSYFSSLIVSITYFNVFGLLRCVVDVVAPKVVAVLVSSLTCWDTTYYPPCSIPGGASLLCAIPSGSCTSVRAPISSGTFPWAACSHFTTASDWIGSGIHCIGGNLWGVLSLVPVLNLSLVATRC